MTTSGPQGWGQTAKHVTETSYMRTVHCEPGSRIIIWLPVVNQAVDGTTQTATTTSWAMTTQHWTKTLSHAVLSSSDLLYSFTKHNYNNADKHIDRDTISAGYNG